jgi:CDP-paratose 2-epimerase
VLSDEPSPRVLVTGGAGFVGANLAVELARRHPGWELVAFDNLHRRGSELNLERLREAGVSFVHGDVRDQDDLAALRGFHALVECSAEPSALAGTGGDTAYALRSNLVGAHHCLELAVRESAQFVFLSTSRVYPYGALNALQIAEGPSRYELLAEQDVRGASGAGISEDFTLDGPRTLYGATKLAAELLVTEYGAAFGLATVVNRCGVIAGPWQMGRVDQGVFTHWLLSHRFGADLSYIGYGGTGKQVRDLLHVDDLIDLLDEQLLDPDRWRGITVNVGGGREVSLSLREATELCRELSGNEVAVEPSDEQRPGDVRIYLSDCRRLFERTDWRPRRDARQILADTMDWIAANERAVRRSLVG